MNATVNLKTQQEIGKKFKETRERKNLSQEEVADGSEISTTYYAGIERGEENPTISVVEHICNSLNLRFRDICPF